MLKISDRLEAAEAAKKVAEGQIAKCHAEQRMCKHVWSKTVYTPWTKENFITTGYEGVGSDPTAIGVFEKEKVDRWSRTCDTCGKIEHTDKRIAVTTEADFS
jgi:hypothetical protein